MKCHLCPNWIEIHTDPKNAAYVIINGARKREEEYDPKAIGLIDLPDEKEKERLEQDPFYRLEHNLEDETKAKETFLSLEQMQKYNNEHWKDPYTANQILRNGFRAEKKHQKRLQIEANEVKDRLDLSIPILPASEEDTIQAQKIDWKEYTIDSGRAPKQASVQGQAIFASKKSAAITPKERLKQLLQRKRSDPFAVFSK
jgi:coiled-coil domain-containing protein 130